MRGFAGRDLISINDFTKEEIETVFYLADQMSSRLKKGERIELCKGKDMATLFYEPSTRTRGSFERAMHKLGGEVVSFADAQAASSAAKGETIADTVRVLESYADIIVIRHPLEGAARVAADYAQVPVINAGDGSHEHPTQTLCDLYTIKKEKGRIKGLTVCLWGDLKYGRTVHSLIYTLVRFGAEVFLAAVQDLEMPQSILSEIRSEYNYIPIKVKPDELPSMMGILDALYIAPPKLQLSLFSGVGVVSSIEVSIKDEIKHEMGIREAVEKVEALYVTRVQSERRSKSSDHLQKAESYPVVNGKFLRDFRKQTLVMHPLPRANELAYELDDYPRSVYFKQAAYGVPIRMALTALLLGDSQMEASEGRDSFVSKTAYNECKEVFGVKCQNQNCVSKHETEKRYVKPAFKIIAKKPLTLRCVYCDYETHPPYIASSKWHQGILKNKKYYSSNSFMLDQIRPENLIIFASARDAQAHEFIPGKRTAKQRIRGDAT